MELEAQNLPSILKQLENWTKFTKQVFSHWTPSGTGQWFLREGKAMMWALPVPLLMTFTGTLEQEPKQSLMVMLS